MNPTTESGDGAIAPYTTTPKNEGLSTPYEQWKQKHGYKPADKPRLEVGQRVKLTDVLESAEWFQGGSELAPAGMGGVVAKVLHGGYRVDFDNGVSLCMDWEHDEENPEMIPVGKSPSQLAAEKAEAERLAQWQQLPLFAASAESEAGK